MGVYEKLQALRVSVASGLTDIDEARTEFQALTYSIYDTTREDEQILLEMVNDVERIQFGHLPEDQVQAVCDVLVEAEAIFERYR